MGQVAAALLIIRGSFSNLWKGMKRAGMVHPGGRQPGSMKLTDHVNSTQLKHPSRLLLSLGFQPLSPPLSLFNFQRLVGFVSTVVVGRWQTRIYLYSWISLLTLGIGLQFSTRHMLLTSHIRFWDTSPDDNLQHLYRTWNFHLGLYKSDRIQPEAIMVPRRL